MAAGPAIASYRSSMGRSAYDASSTLFESAKKREQDKYDAILKMNGPENPFQLHAELGQMMLIDVTIERHNDRLDGVLAKIEEIDARSRNVGVLDTSSRMNQSAQFVRHLQNMIVLARVIAQGARNRDESRGAHFKPAFKERDDANWLRSTLAMHKEGPNGHGQVNYVRELSYNINGKPLTVSDAVDVSLVKPRPRKYETAGAASATAADEKPKAAPSTATV
jgi:succinate dehydrogenase / fumarate reductase flavoprotein subunit